METTTSPVPEKKSDDKSSHLDFSQAIKKVIEGKKVHKLEWEDKGYYGYLKDEVLILHKPDGKKFQWILSKGDLEGIDYIVL